ncbi:MAG: Transcriptional regulator, RHH-like, CopG [Bacteriophage sp.]|nr:MAG: Transcriptional regulator, RHH-like, CopG [Bacteriophage sp.]
MIERSFRIPDDVYMKLKEISERENVRISDIVRTAIRRFVANYEDSIDFVDAVMKD